MDQGKREEIMEYLKAIVVGGEGEREREREANKAESEAERKAVSVWIGLSK
jgi:hypothetical protein